MNYRKWIQQDLPYLIDYEQYFEPYIVARKPTKFESVSTHTTPAMPQYDVRFEGYGNDKDQLHFELVARHFRYWVLPDVFVMHFQHAPTTWAQLQLPTMSRRWRTFSLFYAELWNELGHLI